MKKWTTTIITLTINSVALAQETKAVSDSTVLMFFLPLLTLIAGVIIWSIRQEGEIKQNKIANQHTADALSEHKRTQEVITKDLFNKYDVLNSEIASRILDTNKAISKMEGKLDVLISLYKDNGGKKS